MAAFDVATARSRFPALQQEQGVHGQCGKEARSSTLWLTRSSIRSYLLSTNVQLGATYKISQASTAAYTDAYKIAASFINASPDEISIGVSTTQLLHNLSTALRFQAGDELILSKLNHEANTAAWVRIADRLGLTVKWWAAADPKNPVCDPAELKSLLSDRTRLVACPHASNITGTISPIREIAHVVHTSPRALLCVDGVALAPHRPVDVQALGVDFYVSCCVVDVVFGLLNIANPLYSRPFRGIRCTAGPHLAQLYAASRIHDQIQSLGHFFKPTDTLDLKLNLASANYELTQSIPRIVEYFGPDLRKTWDQMATHEERLQQILLEFLASHDRITVIGEPSAHQERRVPVISFVVQGVGSQQLVEAVERRSAFGFRSGHMYSHRLLADVCGLQDVEDGVVRVSVLHYNTEAEVQGLVEVLRKVLTSL